MALNPDGSLLVTGFGGAGDGLIVWDFARREMERIVPLPHGTHYSVCFSPDGKLLACDHGDEGVQVFETRAFQRHAHWRSDTVQGCCFSPDGQSLAFYTLTGVLTVWRHTLPGSSPARLPDKLTGSGVAFSADGRFLISAGPRVVHIRNVANSGERLVLAGHASGVPVVAFSPDGKLLASGSKDKTVALWDTQTGRALPTLPALTHYVQALAFSPDGQVLATGDYHRGLRLWDVATRTELEAPGRPPGEFLYAVAFSPDGQYLAASAGGLSVWRIERGSCAADPSSWKYEPVVTITGRQSLYLAFSADSSLLAWVDNQIAVRLLDPRSGREVPFAGSPLLNGWHNLAFQGNNRVAFVSRSRMAEFWNVDDGSKAFDLGQPNEFASFHVALSGDGQWLASDPSPTAVTLWDTEQRKRLFDLREEESPIWSMAWSA